MSDRPHTAPIPDPHQAPGPAPPFPDPAHGTAPAATGPSHLLTSPLTSNLVPKMELRSTNKHRERKCLTKKEILGEDMLHNAWMSVCEVCVCVLANVCVCVFVEGGIQYRNEN